MGLRFKKNNGTDYPKWKTYSLGEIYTERNERGDSSLPILSVSIHTGVSCGELDEDVLGKRVNRSADKTLYKKVEVGDFVFNMMRAWQGGYGVAPVAGMVSPAYIVAKPNDLVNPIYMEYALRSKRMLSYFNRQSYGVMDFRKRLYWNSFTPIKCTLPCKEEQNLVIQSLSPLDTLISSSEEEISNLVEQKKGMMQKLFSQEIRFQTDDGNYYPEWDDQTLSELATISKGKQLDKRDIIADGKYYHLNGGVTPSNRTNLFNTPANTISISEGGNSCGYVIWNKVPFFSGGHNYVLKGIRDDVDPVYLFQYLKYKENNLMLLRVGSGLPNIQMKSISSFLVKIPTFEEQEKIASFLASFDDAISAAKEELECWKNIKKGMLQQLFEQEEE